MVEYAKFAFKWLSVFVPLAVARGFTFSVLWGWLMVPTFNVPAIGVVSAIGLSVFVEALLYDPSSPKNAGLRPETMTKAGLGSLFVNVLFLAMGWVVHLFM